MAAQESSWTGERVAQLVTMWERGVSAGLIARELATSRSAVIGKVHRLGLAVRDTSKTHLTLFTERGHQRHRVRNRAAAPKRQGYPQARPARRSRARPRTFNELTAKMCRFILGYPQDVNTLYCAGRTRANSSYCPFHHFITHLHGEYRRRTPGAWS